MTEIERLIADQPSPEPSMSLDKRIDELLNGDFQQTKFAPKQSRYPQKWLAVACSAFFAVIGFVAGRYSVTNLSLSFTKPMVTMNQSLVESSAVANPTNLQMPEVVMAPNQSSEAPQIIRPDYDADLLREFVSANIPPEPLFGFGPLTVVTTNSSSFK